MTTLIPFSQQGTSAWQFQVEYEGLQKRSLLEVMKLATDAGMGYLDLIHPDELAVVMSTGNLKVASLVMLDYDGEGHPPFMVGPNNPANHDLFVANTTKMIDAAAESGICDCVTVFFGDERVNPFSEKVGSKFSLEGGVRNCIAGYKKVVGHAEEKGVTLALELLSSIERDHPMKGHPGYQGDRLAQCQAVINQVGSSRLKLLFDSYHFSLMEPSKTPAEWIRHLGTDAIGHFHLAGKDNRNEPYLDEGIDHTACMQALVDIEWEGPVIHEYLPSVRENLKEALRMSGRLCAG